jgi:hypothetical protein
MVQAAPLTKTKAFIEKAKGRYMRRSIEQRNLQGQTLREIIGKLNPEKSRVY